MAVVSVWPADSPAVRLDGSIWLHVDPRRALATAQDERGLNEKRRLRDQPFDARPCGSANLSDPPSASKVDTSPTRSLQPPGEPDGVFQSVLPAKRSKRISAVGRARLTLLIVGAFASLEG
jgi:hypothetical protein